MPTPPTRIPFLNLRGFGPERLLELDALRGLAALSVVIFHYTHRYDDLFDHPGRWADWFPFRLLHQSGVPLFFIISGFVIPMTLDAALARSARTPSGRRHGGLWRPGVPRAVLDFAIARIARLYPAFVTASVLIYLVLSAADLPGRTPSLDSLLAHFTLVPRLIGYPFVDGVFWTLQVEVVFYALVAAAALLGLRRWLMLILAVPVVIDLALKGHHSFNHFFLLGLVLYETRPAPALPPRPDRPRLTVGRFTPRHTLFLILCLVRMADPRRSGDTIALFAVAGLIWAATRYRIPALTGRALLSLGAISYSLYLVHQNIGYIIIRWGYSQGLPGPVAVLIAVLTVLILASLLTFLVERPANTLLRSWLGGSQRARPSPGITPAQTAPERPHPAG